MTVPRAGGAEAGGGMLPTALVVGPMKAGTTWIHDYLAARGDVVLPLEVKETFFFDRHFARGVAWYGDRFASPPAGGQRTVVEVAPSLFHNRQAPARVRAVLGQIPLVVTTRDPVERSWSHYMHLRRYGYTRAPLAEACELFPEIVEASQYERTLARWRAALPESRITVLALEDLRADPGGYVARLCDALALPMRAPPREALRPANEAASPPSFLLAKLGRTLSHRLRSAGFYGAVTAAKRAGLKPVFFGRPSASSPPPRPSDAERAFLASRIAAVPAGGGETRENSRISEAVAR